MKCTAACVIAWLATGGSWAASPLTQEPSLAKLQPVDEIAHDPSLRKLRDDVLAIAQHRDLSGLAAISAARLKIDDESMTRGQFIAWVRRMQTSFWQELRDGVAAGFARSSDPHDAPMFDAPYVAIMRSRREDSDQPLLAIVGTGVAVHRDPDARSPVIDRLDYDVVRPGEASAEATRAGEFSGDYLWLQIKTPSERLGWVLSKYALDGSEPRFRFRKMNGVWKLVGYITGD
jgi:hypothetical protein